jgi:hypothetical protein
MSQSLQSIMGAMQQRRSNTFITQCFFESVSVVDDRSDRLATMIEMGVASPRAHGQAMMSTETALTIA